jgi:glycosyltransferase involved in cell wall biosynthesis
LLSVPRRLDAANCRRAAAVIVLSQDMRATLVARGLDASNILVLNNFDTIEASDDHDQGLDASDDSRFRLIFAGNMGRVQGLDNLVAAAAQAIIQRPQIEMTFMGSGALVGALKRQAGNGSQIRFLEHRPAADAARVLHGADIGVVSLAPAVYRLAYPSKTSAYLAAGCRLLVVVEANSELAQLVEAETLGSVCPPGDVTALTTAIVAAADRGRADIAERERLAAAGAKYFGRDARLDDWSRLIATLAR